MHLPDKHINDLVIDLCLKSEAWLSFRLMLLGQVHRWCPCSGAWELSLERHGAEEQHLLVCEKIFYFCSIVCLHTQKLQNESPVIVYSPSFCLNRMESLDGNGPPFEYQWPILTLFVQYVRINPAVFNQTST